MTTDQKVAELSHPNLNLVVAVLHSPPQGKAAQITIEERRQSKMRSSIGDRRLGPLSRLRVTAVGFIGPEATICLDSVR